MYVKKNRVRIPFLTALLLAVLLLISGCATSIALDVIKPAEVNMSEYTHLALFDIEPYEFSLLDLTGTIIIDFLAGKDIDQPTGFTLFLERDVAQQFERSILRELSSTGYFTLIPPSQLRAYKKSGSSGAYNSEVLMNNFDVTASLIGRIEDMRFYEDVIEEEVEVDDGTGTGTMVTELRRTFYQEVSIDFSYSILDLRTNQIITTKYLSGERKKATLIEDEETFRAPRLIDMYENVIDDIASRMRYQLVPRTVREYRFLKRDEMEDPDMEAADKLVKAGNYNRALSLFIEIWYETENIAAGYNAAILYEVLGQYRQAVSFMQEVADVTGNPDAIRKVAELKESMDSYNEAAQQMRE